MAQFRIMLAGFAALMAGACSDDIPMQNARAQILLPQDVRQLRLDAINLADMAVVKDITAQLMETERAPFNTYALLHATTSPLYCGEPLINADGHLPETVGEAIQLTLERDERDRAEKLAYSKPLTTVQQEERRRKALRFSVEDVEAEQMWLAQKQGAEVRQSEEWARLEQRKTELREQIAALDER